MFTGIITDIGELAARDGGRFTIRCGYPAAGIAVGASIACDGACLTATEIVPARLRNKAGIVGAALYASRGA